MDLQITPFGTTSRGERVDSILLQHDSLSCTILTYGGAVSSLTVPDRNGHSVDVVLGYDTIETLEAHTYYMGAVVGRCANRIAGGRFTLNSTDYALAINNGPNALHGGIIGFTHRIWQIAQIGDDFVTLHLDSPDMEEGFPGTLSVDVTYRLSHDTLLIDYVSTSDRDTLCNLTNHCYFNLGGHDSGSILSHTLLLNAAYYNPTDNTSIPTGEIAPVEGTPMDFRQMTAIGDRIEDDFEQLRFGAGYDHSFIVDGEIGTLRPTAMTYCPESGIHMETQTTMPAVQFYSANWVTGDPVGKNNTHYDRRQALCLETQFYPDAIHHPEFPQPILKAGETMHDITTYRFSVID